MQTTITECKSHPCSRCAGSRFLPQFQHRNGGECFRCGATGVDPAMTFVEREMTDDEVMSALKIAGFDFIHTERPVTGDFLTDLFLSDDEAAAQADAMKGARLLLAAVPA